jgi:hypothetical protein
VQFEAISGTTYKIAVDGFRPTGNTDPVPTGRFVLQLSPGTPPDTDPPDVTITEKPKQKIKTKKKKVKVTFEFEADEDPVEFGCSLDGESYEICTSPQTYTVKRGSHSFLVRGTDQAVNTSEPEMYDFKVVKKK